MPSMWETIENQTPFYIKELGCDYNPERPRNDDTEDDWLHEAYEGDPIDEADEEDIEESEEYGNGSWW